MQLELAGWDQTWSESFSAIAEENLLAGRVFSAIREQYSLFTTTGETRAEVAGSLVFRADEGGLPAVGDWVAFRQHRPGDLAIIHHVLSRRTKFSRRAAGRVANEQVIAANIDVVFVVAGLDHDYNLRRIERYLAAVSTSGAQAVVVLNKADVCPDWEYRVAEVEGIAPQVPVICTSALDGDGMRELFRYITPNRTGALVGSSGVGKSTIVNALLGSAVQRTKDTRESDGRGRHTTTARELFMLPAGGLLLDTPGMRELQLWESTTSPYEAFADIELRSVSCAFRDCQHETEPWCAVQEAVRSGEIDATRWSSYLKLQKELRHRAREQDIHLRLAEKQRWKRLYKQVKEKQKHRL